MKKFNLVLGIYSTLISDPVIQPMVASGLTGDDINNNDKDDYYSENDFDDSEGDDDYSQDNA